MNPTTSRRIKKGNVIFISVNGYEPHILIDTKTHLWYTHVDKTRSQLIDENYILRTYKNFTYYIGEKTRKIFVTTSIGIPDESKFIPNVKQTHTLIEWKLNRKKWNTVQNGLKLFANYVNS